MLSYVTPFSYSKSHQAVLPKPQILKPLFAGGETFQKSAIKLTPSDFASKHAESFVILTDLEPDDFIAIRALLPHIQGRPLLIVSGGANAAIQNERIQAFIKACQADGLISKNAPVSFVRGCDSPQHFNKQGAEVLSEARLSELAKETNHSPEKGIQEFFEKNAQTHVFCLKRPDEIVGNSDLLKTIQKKKPTLFLYAGGFNVHYPKDEQRKQFMDFCNSFEKISLMQNFPMLQNGGEAHPKGDGTPNNISPETTPRFVKMMENNTESFNFIKKAIRFWNEKIIYNFSKTITTSHLNEAADPLHKANHEKAIGKLKQALPITLKAFSLEDSEKITQLQKALQSVNVDAKPADDARTIEWRLNVLHTTFKNPTTRTIIADPLTALPYIAPELLTNTCQGRLEFENINGRFYLTVKPDDSGRCLSYGPIAGTAGKEGTRIKNIDDFLSKKAHLAIR